MEQKLYYRNVRAGNGHSMKNEYYYKPDGYRSYIKFSPAYGDIMGIPIHGIKLPYEVSPVENISKGVKRMLDFLDRIYKK